MQTVGSYQPMIEQVSSIDPCERENEHKLMFFLEVLFVFGWLADCQITPKPLFIHSYQPSAPVAAGIRIQSD